MNKYCNRHLFVCIILFLGLNLKAIAQDKIATGPVTPSLDSAFVLSTKQAINADDSGLLSDSLNTPTLQQADSTIIHQNAYNKGFQDGYKYYNPSNERIVGACFILFPIVGIPGSLYYSFTKVKDREVQLSYHYRQNKSEYYRSGYLAGAGKRRRVAVWSSFGGTVGAMGLVALMYSSSKNQ